MSEILKTILDQKHLEVRNLKDIKSSFDKRSSPKRPFVSALDKSPLMAVISEVKKASPSKGIIRADFNPVKIAIEYQKGGASAISVLTDQKFFQGDIEYLISVRANTSLPVLRKDFIIHELQVMQTAAINADAMLLIAAALDDSQMKDLFQMATELEVEPLVEIHNGQELDRTMKLEPRIIGINNRNLTTFVTDLKVTFDLVKHIPSDVVVVSESGIDNGSQVSQLASTGVRAILVGESLMKASNVKDLLQELSLSKVE